MKTTGYLLIVILMINSCKTSSDPAPTVDAPPFAGDYIGSWEDLGPPGPAKFPMSLRIANDYTGQMFYANGAFRPFGKGSEDAKTTMTISDTQITSFILDQFIDGYQNGCEATKTLTGHIENGNELVFDKFEWVDCDGIRDVLLKFKKK